MSRRPQSLPFTRFCAEVLRVRLTAGQRAFALVAFDGYDPADLDGDERELARVIFGDVEEVPAIAREVVAGEIGARSGKSYLCSLRKLHLSLTSNLDGLAPGEVAGAITIAPDMRLARQGLRYELGAARAAPSIARLIESETADSFVLRRPDGACVEHVVLPAKRGGSAGRGRTLCAALLDESAFFYGEDYAVNDQEVYKAVAPRIVTGGQCMIVSTPWTESGLLRELCAANFGHPTTCLAAHASTTTMRDDARTRAMVERERERDPGNAEREFDAIPMAAGSSNFFDAAALAACVVADAEVA